MAPPPVAVDAASPLQPTSEPAASAAAASAASAAPARAAATTDVRAVLHAARDLRIERRPLSPPAPGEVQVKILQTGLCGSDLHYYLHGRNGDFALQHPMCLGHESAGVVVAVGDDDDDDGAAPSSPSSSSPSSSAGRARPRVGQRVAVEAGVYCGACERCAEGRYNLCARMRFASSAKTAPHLDGTLRSHVNWPARLCHALPDELSDTSAALLEPLCVVLQALGRAGFRPGETALVVGCGAVGLLACAALRARGARYVVAADIDAAKLGLARRKGWADETYLLPRPAPPRPKTQTQAQAQTEAQPSAAEVAAEETRASVEAWAAMRASLRRAPPPPWVGRGEEAEAAPSAFGGFDAALECTGVPACVRLSIQASRAGGRVALVGMGHPTMSVPLGSAALREVDLLGVFRYAGRYPEAIEMLASMASSSSSSSSSEEERARGEGAEVGKGEGGATRSDVEDIVSHRYPLERAVEAFETLARGRDDGAEPRAVVKVMVGGSET